MPTPIPRPELAPEKSTPHPIPKEIARLLRKGIALDVEMSWGRTLRFALICFPCFWVTFTALGIAWGPTAGVMLWALGWSALSTLLAYVPFYLLAPLWTKAPTLLLQGQQLSLQKKEKVLWSVDMEAPFAAALLYRDHREDALLILQRQPQRDVCYLYGRFRMRHPLPKSAIPITPLGFSLAEQAIDYLDAHMMPDTSNEYLPWITQEVFAAPGHRLQQLRLPLQESSRALRVEPQHLILIEDGDILHRFPLSHLNVQAFRLKDTRKASDSLLLCLSDEDPEHTYTPEETHMIWLAITWPLPLHLIHLPPAQPEEAEQAIRFTWLDALLLLHALHQRGVVSVPFSLFSQKQD
ncbi:MAG: hypothetical protein H6728_11350 [Myxococcales bacterium]|nr:hypothetical protein [Myxococcales bacterium]MCB9643658.1 hypothetical protein [Myxococcales bacterium]